MSSSSFSIISKKNRNHHQSTPSVGSQEKLEINVLDTGVIWEPSFVHQQTLWMKYRDRSWWLLLTIIVTNILSPSWCLLHSYYRNTDSIQDLKDLANDFRECQITLRDAGSRLRSRFMTFHTIRGNLGSTVSRRWWFLMLIPIHHAWWSTSLY